MYSVDCKEKINNMNCVICKNEIPPKRLEVLPNTKTCVNCSQESPKRGVTVMQGSGAHTWVDLMVMDQDEFEVYEEHLEKERKEFGSK